MWSVTLSDSFAFALVNVVIVHLVMRRTTSAVSLLTEVGGYDTKEEQTVSMISFRYDSNMRRKWLIINLHRDGLRDICDIIRPRECAANISFLTIL